MTVFRRLWPPLLYAVAALVLTWPLAQHFGTHMPGNGIDDPALGWNLWWIKTRLLNQLSLDIFHARWMFHPIGINLAFYTLTPLNGLLSIPLQLGLNLVIANNILLLSSFVLSGYGTFLLVRMLLVEDMRLGQYRNACRLSGWLCLCLCCAENVLRRTGPIQHCQQPVDSILCALHLAHGA